MEPGSGDAILHSDCCSSVGERRVHMEKRHEKRVWWEIRKNLRLGSNEAEIQSQPHDRKRFIDSPNPLKQIILAWRGGDLIVQVVGHCKKNIDTYMRDSLTEDEEAAPAARLNQDPLK